MTARKRTGRTIRQLRPETREFPGVLSIRSGEMVHHYAYREIPCEIGGRGFALHRLGLGDLYHVRIGTPAECSCECLGYLRHGYCKHIDGLKALAPRLPNR